MMRRRNFLASLALSFSLIAAPAVLLAGKKINGVEVPPERFTFQVRPVPNSSTDIVAVQVWVTSVMVTNITGTVAHYTLEDKAGTPYEFLEARDIPPNDFLLLEFRDPMPFVGGITHAAETASALNVVISGWRTKTP